jgi:hypothetical protein
MTRSPQGTFTRITKNNQIFRLEYNNEVVVVATDQHLSPWLDKTINHTRSYCHFTHFHFRAQLSAEHVRVPSSHAVMVTCTGRQVKGRSCIAVLCNDLVKPNDLAIVSSPKQ